MRKKIYVFLDKKTLSWLENTPFMQTAPSRSRAIEYYLTLGMSLANRFELTWPLIVQDFEDTTKRLQAIQKAEAKAGRKLFKKR